MLASKKMNWVSRVWKSMMDAIILPQSVDYSESLSGKFEKITPQKVTRNKALSYK